MNIVYMSSCKDTMPSTTIDLGIMQFVTLFSEYYKFVYIANPRWY